VFKVASDLVAIDLVAADSEGRFVADLRPEEIEILEDGKRQELLFLNVVQLAAAAAPAAPVAALPGPSSPGDTLRGAPSGGIDMVVVVDLGSTPPDALPRVREAITSMATQELPSGTRMMLVLVDRSIQIRQPFTSNTAAFLAAVRELPSPSAAGRSLGELTEGVDRSCDGSPEGLQSAIGLGRAYVDEARYALSTVVDAISNLTRLLGSLPGRKHVVLYSAGYPMDPTSAAVDTIGRVCIAPGTANEGVARQRVRDGFPAGRGEEAVDQLRRLTDDANRTQVSVYAVDSRGLMSDAPAANSRASARTARRGQLQEALREDTRAPQQLLASIAEQTGGRAYLNTNDLARGMRAAASDARGYYLLGYTPPGDRKEGRFYAVQVKVARPGLELRYRRGYRWLTDKQRRDQAIAAACRFPGLYEGPELDAEAAVGGGKLKVTAFISTRALVFRNEAGEHRNDLELYALLRDERGRSVGDRYLLAKDLALRLNEARYTDLRGRDDVEIANEAAAPKRGRYRLTVVVRHSGGRLAAKVIEVVVP
jgi:VWFA-related protein